MILTVSADGTTRCLYTEAISLPALGLVGRPERASHVEPDEFGAWFADLSPVAGPTLGPFALRSEALAAEAEWIENNRL